MIETTVFGRLGGGEAVTLYRLRNTLGDCVELLDYGASIHAVRLRDRQGRLRDVTLGAPDAPALEQFSYEGVTIGRVANRIAHGRCTIEGTPLQLDCNHRGHFMHGGSGNYAHRFFRAEPLPDGQAVRFALLDGGEGGFGCPADVEVTFRFGDDRALRISYRMTAGGTTIFCPTNHVYFDLSAQGDLLPQRLQVAAARRAVKGPLGMPQGETAPVDGSPMDYRRPRPLGDALLQAAREGFFGGEIPQMDDTFLLDGGEGPAAALYCPATGLGLRMYTDMPAVVAFTPFCRGPRPGKPGRYYAGYCGLALETQFVPNAVNCPQYGQPVFHKGEALVSQTTYAFFVREEGGSNDE